MQRVFTLEEVAQHSQEGDLYIIVDGLVFDVSNFDHPGGINTLLSVAGRDATKEFHEYHGPEVLARYIKDNQSLCIGRLDTYEPEVPIEHRTDPHGAFGTQEPYSDPSWYRLHWQSPYYKASHREVRRAVRNFVSRIVSPYVSDWEQARRVPRSVFRQLGAEGLFAAVMCRRCPSRLLTTRSSSSGVMSSEKELNKEDADDDPAVVPQLSGKNRTSLSSQAYKAADPDLDLSIALPGNVPLEEWDTFHELVTLDEFSRCGSAGVCWSLLGGICGGLPPVMHYGNEYLQQTVAKPVLRGDAIISLAITEPYCGTDAASVRTVAAIEPDGSAFILNGEKKWIPNATTSDFFTMAVRTRSDLKFVPTEGSPVAESDELSQSAQLNLTWDRDRPDPKFSTKRPGSDSQVSLIVVPRNTPGLTVEPIECGGAHAAGLGTIRLRNARVPVEYLVGSPNSGLSYVLHNFNHERWMFAIFATRFARMCVNEALRWSLRRRTFGVPLTSHGVIRSSLAQALRSVEASQSLIENLTYQLMVMPPHVALRALIGPIALAKGFASTTLEEAARVATKVMGSKGYTQGSLSERLARDVRAISIPAGSDEILADLAIRMAVRDAHLTSRSTSML